MLKASAMKRGHAKCTSGLVRCSGFSGLPRNSASSMCWIRLDAPFLFLLKTICTVLVIVNKLWVVKNRVVIDVAFSLEFCFVFSAHVTFNITFIYIYIAEMLVLCRSSV